MTHDKNIEYLIKISDGDSDVFRLFYNENYIQIYRIVSYYIASREAREEVVSDVFFKIWTNRKKLTKIDNIDSYLFILARNESFDYIKKTKEAISIDDLPIGIVSQEMKPDDSIIDKELNLQIEKSIQELPYNCKLIFLMVREQGLKYKEVASILNISEKTVNAQMVIAIKKLSKALLKYFYIFFSVFFHTLR